MEIFALTRDGFDELPAAFGVAVLIVTAATVLRARRRRARAGQSAHRDPDRTFSSPVRRTVFERAGHRCEFDGFPWWCRCRRRAEHADHFFPWAAGGASSEPNCVAACAFHNLSKGARMPSRGLQYRIGARRRRGGAAVGAVGQWYGRPVGQR